VRSGASSYSPPQLAATNEVGQLKLEAGLAPEPDRLRRIKEARRTGRSQPVAEVYSGRSRRVAAVCLDAAVLRHVAEVETRHPELSRHAEDLPKEGTIED